MKELAIKIVGTLLCIVLSPFHFLAYVVAHIFRLEDRENMPTPIEWFMLIPEVWTESEVM